MNYNKHGSRGYKRQKWPSWFRMLFDKDPPDMPTSEPTLATGKFNKDFDGWNIRLHKANGGHIIEAWRHHNDRYTISPTKSSGSSYEHEMFLVKEDEDLIVVLPQVLTQLMLKGN